MDENVSRALEVMDAHWAGYATAKQTIRARLVELEAAEMDAAEVLALLPGVYYTDPPDGGDVSVIEQLRRMAKDAARYRWLRDRAGNKILETLKSKFNTRGLDAAIDADTQDGEG